ncbi:hypothetical protein EMCRGX_G016458 [Ephydatia muelleri]
MLEKKVATTEVSVTKCDIYSVVVYRDRAEVRRVVHAHLSPGDNKVIVNGLAAVVQANSIRVEGEGKAKITDVIFNASTVTKEISGPQEDGSSKREHEKMVEEIGERQKELKHLQLKEEVLKKEKELLSTLASHASKVHTVKGDDQTLNSLSSEDMVKMVMDFFERYEGKVAGVEQTLNQIREEMKRVSERIQVLCTNADKLDPTRKTKTTETVRCVHIGLEASEETDVTLLVSYVVSNASWSPAYDVRVLPVTKEMKVQYYGLIKQSTGEDWINAKISLSTAQPSLGGAPPTLGPHSIKFKTPRYYPSSRVAQHFCDEYDPTIEDYSVSVLMDEEAGERGAVEEKKSKKKKDSSASPARAIEVETAQVSTGLYNTSYAIPRASNIPSDSTEHKVTVAIIDLKPELSYVAVPRHSPYCFLKAKVQNVSPYAMLAGSANIFLGNNFVGKSNLSDVSPNEEMTLHLGAEQSIRISVHPVLTVRGNTRSIGKSNQTVTSTHTVAIKNTKESVVSIDVSDQLPLSSDDKIKVTLVEPNLKRPEVPHGSVTLHPHTNNLEWHLELPPDTEVTLKMEYVVEYPPNCFVAGLPK